MANHASKYLLLFNLFNKNLLIPKYGKIDAELIYKYVAPMSETGDS